ncbi:MAG: DNA primase [Alphaproteobacteria bacterium]|nr:DNA primase [Alphaproteobacteria bacterium]
MALSPAFLDELRARTPLPALIGRKVRLARSGRQLKGCCPFHGEKTPSFYVYDDHFHCFGCGAHGDAISFVMQSQGAGFAEAVEQLAAEAGLQVPKPSPAAAEAERRRLDVQGVLQAAQAVFERRLFQPEGRAALDYLLGRGLSEATIRRFGLGWSGEGRGSLAAELGREGIEAAMLAEAGLVRPAEEPGRFNDLFFNRVMFPIRDRRGRVISFGGRTLGAGQPKYVNGPETAVFSKRRTLFGADMAREAARGGAPVIVVEGYMDVIALHQAGFAGAVAPLGTALTEEQLGELWNLTPAPILCFDGDAAGGRAAHRAAELALPKLAPDRTLRFAPLPSGEDPDTVVHRKGAPAFQALLDAARPLSEALFDLLREGGALDLPEQRAAFRARLEAAALRIPDKALASEYRRALLDKFFAGRRSAIPKRGAPRSAAIRPTPPRAALNGEDAAAERGRILVAILLRHPDLLHDVGHAFSDLTLAAPFERLRHALFGWSDHADVLDSPALMDHLTSVGLAAEAARALASEPFPLPACAAPDAMPAEAEAGWWHIFGLVHRGRLEEEVAAASRAFAERADEAAQRRLIALCAARDAVRRVEQEEAEA